MEGVSLVYNRNSCRRGSSGVTAAGSLGGGFSQAADVPGVGSGPRSRQRRFPSGKGECVRAASFCPGSLLVPWPQPKQRDPWSIHLWGQGLVVFTEYVCLHMFSVCLQCLFYYTFKDAMRCMPTVWIARLPIGHRPVAIRSGSGSRPDPSAPYLIAASARSVGHCHLSDERQPCQGRTLGQ